MLPAAEERKGFLVLLSTKEAVLLTV